MVVLGDQDALACVFFSAMAPRSRSGLVTAPELIQNRHVIRGRTLGRPDPFMGASVYDCRILISTG
jgi:hypothetical protein